MKVAKYPTIRRNIMKYAKKAGFVCVRHDAGATFSLWDIAMGYYTHKFLTADQVARVVIDELSMIEYAKAHP